ncbi:NAD(P)/FAD-dependent oxidoreductase [Microbacterium sp. CPCC 204701]|uniref:NAD(P)/FAD-dependent oxidoreductase n=1 Tax=Microbacterium sp. CPCC 204701 TaxID=2493084 RepID=UPI000FD9115C|nr:NAD(P)/FAD-dependent oxidoreductase [Microbacterium sp. CPCC 204701]
MSDQADVLIVGAGPVGLYAAYYAGFRGMSAIVVDSLPEVGGQISAMYPEKYLYDIAGFPRIKGRELVENLTAQMSVFAHPVLLGEQAVSLAGELGDFELTTASGHRFHARSVVITGGIGTFTPRRPPVATEYEGRGLSYFVKDPELLRGADVVVLGGGDSAVDWALTLEDVAGSVALVHRRDQFRAHEHSLALLRASRVEVLTSAQIAAAYGEDVLNAVDVVCAGETLSRKADHVVSALGFIADLGPLTEWGLEMRERHIAVDPHMSTSRRGVYAAGDISDFDGKVRLLAVGFGEAATAINNLAVALRPELSLMPGHSSDQVTSGALV